MKKIYMFPFLFALYPILFLYSYNVKELLLSDLVLPVILSLILTLAIVLILKFFIKNHEKASIITTLLILTFSFYGMIFDMFSKNTTAILKHRHTLASTIFVTGYISYFIYTIKKSERLKSAAKILTIISIVLILINIINILPNEVKKASLNNKTIKTMSYEENFEKNYPDIYYIALDEYASLDTIKNIWGYDNSNLKAELEDMGFYVATNSKVHSTDTRYSTASTLNMEYISEKEDILNVWRMINDNKVVNYLKSKGYTTIAFDNIYNLIYKAKGKMEVDELYDFRENLNEQKFENLFMNLLINNSILRPVYEYSGENSKYIEKTATLYTLNKLRDIPSTKSPKFVYAHILCPHLPFVFGPNGEEVETINSRNWSDKKYYRDQYIYITNEIKELANHILKESKTAPIIIIQSDHGPRGSEVNDNSLYLPKEEAYKIFNAYYLPGFDNRNINNDISPVNSFRLVFNHYFNDTLELKED